MAATPISWTEAARIRRPQPLDGGTEAPWLNIARCWLVSTFHVDWQVAHSRRDALMVGSVRYVCVSADARSVTDWRRSLLL